MIFEIHTDGGSRGNPGPAASAFVVESGGGLIKEKARFLGKATNNFAEYTALIMALEWVYENKNNYQVKALVFYLDSELVVKQVKGIYKVKDISIRELHTKVMELIKLININADFKHVPRALNKHADLLVNKELDSQ
jgi:ribonuclease HI